tara:strand:- start:820 stop:1344 length:525 start_codon:yes stop_codon:yes gene_type:complete
MNKNLKDMISASLNDDMDGFKASFETEVNDRISSKIAQKHVEVSQNIMQSDVEEAFSKKAKANKYSFKSSTDAKKFIKAVLKTGAKKTNIKTSGNAVVVKDLDDGDMGELIYFMAKDMNSVGESAAIENKKSINNLLEQLDTETKNILVNGIANDEMTYAEILDLAKELTDDIN